MSIASPEITRLNGLAGLIRAAFVSAPALFRRIEIKTKIGADVSLFAVNDGEMILDLSPVQGPHSQLYSQLHLSRVYPLVEELRMRLQRQTGRFDGTSIVSEPGILSFGDCLAGLEGNIRVGDDEYSTRFNAVAIPVPWTSVSYMDLIDISRSVPR